MKTMNITLLLGAALALAPRYAAAQEAAAGADVNAQVGAEANAAAPAADSAVEGEWTPNSMQRKVGLSYDLWSTANTTAMAWGIDGHVNVTPNIFIDAEINLGYGSLSFFGTDVSKFIFGNPMVGAHYARFISPDLSFHAGGGIGIPVLADPSNEGAFAATIVGISRAGDDLHRFAPKNLPIRFGGGIEYRIMPILFFRADLFPTLYIGLGSGTDTNFYMSQGNEIEYRHEVGFVGGFRFQEVFTWTENDLIQLAMEPYVGYMQPGKTGFYGRLGFLMALDKDLGFAFDTGKVRTMRLSAGYRF